MPPKSIRPPNRGKRAVPVTLSAPTGGLNGRDSFVGMPPTDAFLLDNWFPNRNAVDTRGGSLDWATGMPDAVESVVVYTGAAGSAMLAFSGGDIYDVTASGAVGAALASGRVSNRITSHMFSNAGTQFLLIYSGADEPLSFDGTTLTGLTITGLTGSQNTLLAGLTFKGRVFLMQTGQLGFYYLGIGAIQGAAEFFDLQQQSLKGGTLVAMTTFSQEGTGDGPQDYAVFVTSEGEYIMYAGIDPSSDETWTLVGRYYGPPPIGKNGWFKFRSDVYFITEEGVLSLTQIRQMGEANQNEEYITSKLGRFYTDATEIIANQSTLGWVGMMYPRGSALFVNVPISGATNGPYVQYVMNTNTNAWCRYTDWNAICWTLFNRRAYFGTFDGKVVLADEGFTDNDMQVQASCRQAWNAFDDENGMGEADKHFHFATFAMQADGVPSIACALNVNFEDEQPQYPTALLPTGGAVWDVATWDIDDWANAPSTQHITVSVGKIGFTASLWMQAASVAAKVRWFATRVVLEKTRGVLVG